MTEKENDNSCQKKKKRRHENTQNDDAENGSSKKKRKSFKGKDTYSEHPEKTSVQAAVSEERDSLKSKERSVCQIETPLSPVIGQACSSFVEGISSENSTKLKKRNKKKTKKKDKKESEVDEKKRRWKGGKEVKEDDCKLLSHIEHDEIVRKVHSREKRKKKISNYEQQEVNVDIQQGNTERESMSCVSEIKKNPHVGNSKESMFSDVDRSSEIKQETPAIGKHTNERETSRKKKHKKRSSECKEEDEQYRSNFVTSERKCKNTKSKFSKYDKEQLDSGHLKKKKKSKNSDKDKNNKHSSSQPFVANIHGERKDEKAIPVTVTECENEKKVRKHKKHQTDITGCVKEVKRTKKESIELPDIVGDYRQEGKKHKKLKYSEKTESEAKTSWKQCDENSFIGSMSESHKDKKKDKKKKKKKEYTHKDKEKDQKLKSENSHGEKKKDKKLKTEHSHGEMKKDKKLKEDRVSTAILKSANDPKTEGPCEDLSIAEKMDTANAEPSVASGQWATAGFENEQRQLKFFRLLGGFKKSSELSNSSNTPVEKKKISDSVNGRGDYYDLGGNKHKPRSRVSHKETVDPKIAQQSVDLFLSNLDGSGALRKLTTLAVQKREVAVPTIIHFDSLSVHYRADLVEQNGLDDAYNDDGYLTTCVHSRIAQYVRKFDHVEQGRILLKLMNVLLKEYQVFCQHNLNLVQTGNECI